MTRRSVLRRHLAVCALTGLAGLLAGCASAVSTSTTTSSRASSTTAVVLGADGLGIVQTGDPQASTVRTVSRYLGPPTEKAAPGPCHGTTEVQWSDLSLEFSHADFDGYRYMVGGLSDAGTFHPPTGHGIPVLRTMAGATLGMTLSEVRPLYPATDFSEEQGGSIVVSGTRTGDRLFLGFFNTGSSAPLTEIKGGSTCGDV